MLAFGQNKNQFRILQLADIQFCDFMDKDSIELLDKLILSTNPDMIALSGDQISGEYFIFKKSKAKKVLNQIVEYFHSKNIPWSMCFGNHDDLFCGLKKQEMLEIYTKSKYFIGGNNRKKGFECFSDKKQNTYSNFFVPVYNNDDNIAFGVIFLDCATNFQPPYDCMTDGQIDFFEHICQKYRDLPMIMFTHEPTYEFQLMYEQRSNPDKTQCFLGDIEPSKKDSVNYPTNQPMQSIKFAEIMTKYKNIKGIFVGHDHLSNFAGIYKFDDEYKCIFGFGRLSSYGFGARKYYPFSSKKRNIYNAYSKGARIIDFCNDKIVTADIFEVQNSQKELVYGNTVVLDLNKNQ